MKNITLDNGQLAIIQTNAIMIIFITNDKRTLMSTVTNLSLFHSMIEPNIKIRDDCMILIDSDTHIIMTEMCNNNFITLLLHQIEIMQQEIMNVKLCVHETAYVNAIEMCDNIPLNSRVLIFDTSNNTNVCVSDEETTININENLKFNKSMIHILCANIIFKEKFNLSFDWKNLPEKIKNVAVNNNYMLKSFVNNMHSMTVIPESIKIFNSQLDVIDLDIMMKYKPDIKIQHNNKLIKYKRIEMSNNE